MSVQLEELLADESERCSGVQPEFSVEDSLESCSFERVEVPTADPSGRFSLEQLVVLVGDAFERCSYARLEVSKEGSLEGCSCFRL